MHRPAIIASLPIHPIITGHIIHQRLQYIFFLAVILHNIFRHDLEIPYHTGLSFQSMDIFFATAGPRFRALLPSRLPNVATVQRLGPADGSMGLRYA